MIGRAAARVVWMVGVGVCAWLGACEEAEKTKTHPTQEATTEGAHVVLPGGSVLDVNDDASTTQPAVATEDVPGESQATMPTPDDASSRPEPPPELVLPAVPAIARMPSRGADAQGARLTVIAWVDFESQVSQRMRGLITKLGETYKSEVRVVVAQLPLPQNEHAEFAAYAALSAHAQGKFWPFYDVLLDNANTLGEHDIEMLTLDHRLDLPKLRRAVAEQQFAAQIKEESEFAAAMGLRSPGLLVAGKAHSGLMLTWDTLQAEVEAELAATKTLTLTGDALWEARFKATFAPLPPPNVPPSLPSARRHVALGDSPARGDAQALITAVVFTSFRCTYCHDATQRLRKLMTTSYAGQIKLVFKHFPSNNSPDTLLVHRASIAAHGQGKFWEFLDWLATHNPETLPPLTREQLIHGAKALGLDTARFSAALDDPATQAVIDADMATARIANVHGVPQFFFNGVRFSGSQPIGAFRAALERELDVAQKLITQGLKPEALYEHLTALAATNPPGPLGPPELLPSTQGQDEAPHQAPSIGSLNAPVTLVSFLDFGSAFCAEAAITVQGIVDAYPGRVRWVFKHFPLDDDARSWQVGRAAVAARRQGVEQFWAYQKLLFAHKGEVTPEVLSGYAARAGLNVAQFDADLRDPTLDDVLRRDMQEARALGLSGAPGILLNGQQLRGSQPQAVLGALVEQALSDAAP